MIDRYNPLTFSSHTDEPTRSQEVSENSKADVTHGVLTDAPITKARKGKGKRNVSP